MTMVYILDTIDNFFFEKLNLILFCIVYSSRELHYIVLNLKQINKKNNNKVKIIWR